MREGFGDVAPGGPEVEQGDFVGGERVLYLLCGGSEVKEGRAQVERFAFEQRVLLFGGKEALDVDLVHADFELFIVFR